MDRCMEIRNQIHGNHSYWIHSQETMGRASCFTSWRGHNLVVINFNASVKGTISDRCQVRLLHKLISSDFSVSYGMCLQSTVLRLSLKLHLQHKFLSIWTENLMPRDLTVFCTRFCSLVKRITLSHKSTTISGTKIERSVGENFSSLCTHSGV